MAKGSKQRKKRYPGLIRAQPDEDVPRSVVVVRLGMAFRYLRDEAAAYNLGPVVNGTERVIKILDAYGAEQDGGTKPRPPQ